MSRVSDQVLNEIRSRIDIVDLIGSRVTLKRVGGTYKACCPFHNEKTPSFHVNPARQSYHCFGCGEHGDVFKFLMKQDGLTFMDAVTQLADKAGVPISTETDYHAETRNKLLAIHADLAAFYQRCLDIPSADIARRYLAERRMPADIVKQFAIGYAPKGRDVLTQFGAKHGYTDEDLVAAGLLAPPSRPGSHDYYDRFQGRLMFPICDALGRVCAFSGRILDKSHPAKYVNSPETDIFVKSKILYALDKAREKIVKHPRREAIVCEGQIDVIRCHSAGFDTAVASQGTAFTPQHVALLKRYADSVMLVFDGDVAGTKAAIRTGGLFLEAEIPVRVARLPVGEDPDSLIRDKGSAAFKACLDDAVSLTAYQIAQAQAAETDPQAVDAIRRISRAVLETLAPCPNAVLRAHLIQEAARLLNLPASALEEDLASLRSEAERRAELGQRFARHTTTPDRETRTDEADAPDGESPPLADDGLTPDDEADDEAAGESADENGAAQTAAKRPPSESPADRALHESLCELLLHHSHNIGILERIAAHLPTDIIADDYTRRIVDSVLKASHDGTATLALGTAGDPEFAQFVDRVLGRDGRMAAAREATPEEAVEDLIRQLWIRSLEIRRTRMIQMQQPEEQRVALTYLIKLFKTQPWQTLRRYMTAAGIPTPQMPVHPAPSAKPTIKPTESRPSARETPPPYAPAADSASLADDPEEFLSNVCPLDGMTD